MLLGDNLTGYPYTTTGRDSVVGIATCYGLEGPGIESRWGARFSAPIQTGFPGGKDGLGVTLTTQPL
jgi:hypothetical protein